MRYSAKHFVHHAKQLQAIQRTRTNVPDTTYETILELAVSSPDVARYFGMSSETVGGKELQAKVKEHFASLGLVPSDWRR